MFVTDRQTHRWTSSLKAPFHYAARRLNKLIPKLLNLKPDKFFMGKPSQNHGCQSPKYGVTQFYLQHDISEHTPPAPQPVIAGIRFTYPGGMEG